MYILLDVCNNPGILRVIYFGLILIDIVTVVVPIGLIVMLLLDFTKAVIANNYEEQRKSTKLVVRRIVFAVLVFFVPWIVSLFTDILSNVGLSVPDYVVCITNAKGGNFEYYDQLLEIEEELEEKEHKEQLEQNNSGGTQNNNGSTQVNNAMADELIRIIEGEVGNTNGRKYVNGDYAWCGFFVTWAMRQTEVNGENLFYDVVEKEQKIQNTGGAGCSIYNYNTSSNLRFHYSRFYGKMHNKDTSYIPKPGDTIYFDWSPESPWDGKIISCSGMWNKVSHIGFVHYVEGNTIYTIEGNSGKAVSKRSYDINDNRIIGYGSWYNN